MAEKSSPPARPQLPYSLARPGYLRCKKIIERLRLFQDLVRNDWRWGDHIAVARPLETLLPQGTDKSQFPLILEQHINRLVPLVARDLYVAAVETRIRFERTERNYDFEKHIAVFEEKKEIYDVIEHYFDLPRSRDSFDAVMAAIERGIGIYEGRKAAAISEKYNPVHWLAALVRLPLTVIEDAGISEDTETHSKFANLYMWALKIILLIILGAIATKLGFSTWDNIIKLVAR